MLADWTGSIQKSVYAKGWNSAWLRNDAPNATVIAASVAATNTPWRGRKVSPDQGGKIAACGCGAGSAPANEITLSERNQPAVVSAPTALSNSPPSMQAAMLTPAMRAYRPGAGKRPGNRRKRAAPGSTSTRGA